MKKLQYIFLPGLSLLIIYCSKDDEDTSLKEETSLTEANLIGTRGIIEFYTKNGKVTQKVDVSSDKVLISLCCSIFTCLEYTPLRY